MAPETTRKRRKTDKQILLSKYETIRASILEHNTEAHKGQASEIVLQKLQDLKQIYSQIQLESNRDTLIQLKDSEIFEDTSKFAAVNAQNLKIGSIGTTLTSTEFINKTKQYMNEYDEEETQGNIIVGEARFNTYNWLKLGTLFLHTLSKPIVLDSLYGPLETERKRATPRTRTLDDTSKLTLSTAKNLQAEDISDNSEQNTAHMVKEVYKQFISKSDGEKVNFYEFFVNPKSFAQTVENIFFTSFLIRDARLQIKLENNIPYIMEVDVEDDTSNTATEGSHHIATIDYGTWQYLIDKYNIKESFLDHRPEEEDTWLEEDGI